MFSKAVLAGILGGWRLGLRLVVDFAFALAGGGLLLAYL